MQRLAPLRPSHILVLAACACAPAFGCGSNNAPNASSGTSGAATGSASGSAAASGASGVSSGASGSVSGSSSGGGSGASGSSSSGGSLDAGGEAGEGGSPEAGAGSEAGGLDGAAPDGAVDGGNVTLTVLNFLGWCTVSINGGAASAGPSLAASVAPGSTATLVAQPASMAFVIGADPWFGVSQNDGGAAPGTDNDASGTAATTTATVVVTGNQCVSVCCGDAPTGTGCPMTNPCL
jgi:hypothetical protein